MNLEKIPHTSKSADFLIKMGIVRDFYQRKCEHGNYDIVPELNPKSDFYSKITGINVGGKGKTFQQALGSCTGEVFERISLRILSNKYHSSIVDLHQYFSNRELCRKGMKKTMHLPVLMANNNQKSSKEKLPTFLFHLLKENTSYFTSVGTAFSHDYYTAYKKAVLEVIERHALMYSWYKDIKLSKIRGPSHHGSMTACKPSWYLIETIFNIPVIVCVIKKSGKQFFGSACNESADAAIEQSYLEAMQLLTSAPFAINRSNPLHTTFLKLIKNIPFNLGDDIAVAHDFNFKKIERKLNIYYKDITFQPFRQFGHVIRVFVPELLQLTAKNAPIYRLNELMQVNGKKNNPFV